MDNYISYLINTLDFPEKAKQVILKTENKIKNNPRLSVDFFKICDDYIKHETISIKDAVKKTEDLARRNFIRKYTLDLMFVLHCSETTRLNYLKNGYSAEFFIEGAADFRYKLLECMKKYNVVGTFVADWNDNFLKMRRFTLGRFQYEPETATKNFTSNCGIKIHEGDKIIGFHIPWSGVSLTDEVRYDSYKKAYEFYKDELNGKPLILICHSWLLYPRQTEFLSEKSNVLKFLSDFEMLYWDEGKGKGPNWRLYGKNYPKYLLPSRNSLEAAYTKWIKAGNYGGHGTGIIIFDGENIINKA